jgi:hypothetical protein
MSSVSSFINSMERSLLEKFLVTHLFKKLPAFYRSRSFITMYEWPYNWTLFWAKFCSSVLVYLNCWRMENNYVIRTFIIVALNLILLVLHQGEWNWMNVQYQWENWEMLTKFWLENLKEKLSLGDLALPGKVILNWFYRDTIGCKCMKLDWTD